MKLLQFPPQPSEASPLKRYQLAYGKALDNIKEIIAESPIGLSDDGQIVYLFWQPTPQFQQPRQIAMSVGEFEEVLRWGIKLISPVEVTNEPIRQDVQPPDTTVSPIGAEVLSGLSSPLSPEEWFTPV